jgi:hypothetical protein
MKTIINQVTYTNSILLIKIIYFTAHNTTILHASTSTINTVYKNFYNFRTTFNKDF